jgi:hypothetical protein
MSEEGTRYTVDQGDSVASLSFEHGLFWETVWKHPENADLRKRRGERNILLPGDTIFIPGRRLNHCSCATEKRHTFVKRGVPEKLNIRFLDIEGMPIANEPCVLKIDGRLVPCQLDGDGWLRTTVPPDARTGEIKIGSKGEYGVFQIAVGHLDPITELTGIQARLAHLGYFEGALDGELSDELKQAVLKFRENNKLEESMEIDDEFRNKLKEIHGV